MHIRPATAADCADLAILDDIAGHGLTSEAWARAAAEGKGASALEVGLESYIGQATPCNWRNARVAIGEDRTAGMSVGYFLPKDTDFTGPFDAVFEPVMSLFKKAVGGWLLDALAVYSAFRGKGVARALLDDQLALSENRPFHIVCADDNAPALGLYRSRGFGVVERAEFVHTATPRATEEWLLLKRPGS
jgi:ribosomal protein S18 acetylase RimI-like enzyme